MENTHTHIMNMYIYIYMHIHTCYVYVYACMDSSKMQILKQNMNEFLLFF